jgi:hypothetical protein
MMILFIRDVPDFAGLPSLLHPMNFISGGLEQAHVQWDNFVVRGPFVTCQTNGFNPVACLLLGDVELKILKHHD